MKRIIITLALITALFTPGAAMANISDLIPPFHWTYHSLSNLSAKGLIGEQVTPCLLYTSSWLPWRRLETARRSSLTALRS